MRQYWHFDSNCHKKLSQLSKVMENIGTFKLKIALTRWYSNACEPMKVKTQSELLSSKSYNDQTKLQYFCLWRQQFQLRINSYELKNKAVEQLFQLKVRDSGIELNRAFTIWKDCLQKTNFQKSKVKKLIWKLYFSKLNTAFNSWINYSATLDS